MIPSVRPPTTSQATARIARIEGFKASSSITTKNLVSITSPNGLHNAIISPDFGANVLSYTININGVDREIAYTPLNLDNLPLQTHTMRMSEICGLTPFMFPPGRHKEYDGKTTTQPPFSNITGLKMTDAGIPIHGGLFNRKWKVDKVNDQTLNFSLDTRDPQNQDLRQVYGDIKIDRTYTMTDNGLTLRTWGTNSNNKPLQCAWGSHSYFKTDHRDSCNLEIPSTHSFETDKDNFPTGKIAEDNRFTGIKNLRGIKSDTIFTRLQKDDEGFAHSTLTLDNGEKLKISGQGHSHICVYSPHESDGITPKPFICVEYQTSSAGCFDQQMNSIGTPLTIAPNAAAETIENFALAA